jgi:hypothetical protein
MLSEVYHGRGYKKEKITMQLENFSGKTATAIRQRGRLVKDVISLDKFHASNEMHNLLKKKPERWSSQRPDKNIVLGCR